MELFATVMRDFEMTSCEWWKKKEDSTDRLLVIFDALEEWFREEDFYGCLFVTALGMYPEEDTTIRHFCQEAKRLTQNYTTRLAEKAELQDADELSEYFMLLIEGAITMTQVNNSHLNAIRAKKAAKVLIKGSTPIQAQ